MLISSSDRPHGRSVRAVVKSYVLSSVKRHISGCQCQTFKLTFLKVIQKMEKRKRGRPKKKGDGKKAWQFIRAAIVMSGYDESRERREKHSVAVREAVEFLRRRVPEIRICETEVKSVLSTFRPRGSGTILRFERSPLSEADIQRHRSLREQIVALEKEKGIALPEPPAHDKTRLREKFMIRFSERPVYPRHNSKAPKQ
jgi:hypothetical protein